MIVRSGLAMGLCAAVFATAVTAASGQEAPRAVPTLVERVVVAYESSVHGVVGLRRHFATEVRGGPVRRTEKSESAFLMDDGAFVKIKYYSIVDDGRALSAKQIADREAQTNKDWSAGKVFFKEPYDPRFTGDYRFGAPAACSGCAAGVESVSFTSTVSDAQHGNGTMWIDTATEHVVKLTYVPKAFPPHANSGTVTETGDEAMPNLWYVTRIDEKFSGRAFLLTGSATFVGTFDHFHRFANVGEGEAALESATI